MVLNLSDQDTVNESGSDRVPVPRTEMNESPVNRATLAQISPKKEPERINRERGREETLTERIIREDLQKEPSSYLGSRERHRERGESSEETPLDFSVRRQDSQESTLDSVGESIPPSPSDPFIRRSSSSSEPMSPVTPLPNLKPHEEKIGEPRVGPLGFPTGFPFPPTAGQLPPGFPFNIMANFNLLNNAPIRPPPEAGKTEKSSTRPFKAYPKDPLSLPLGYFGLPGTPALPGIDMAAAQAMGQFNSSEDMFKHYREIIMKRMEQERHPEKARHSPVKDNATPLSPVHRSPNSQQRSPENLHRIPPTSPHQIPPSSPSSVIHSMPPHPSLSSPLRLHQPPFPTAARLDSQTSIESDSEQKSEDQKSAPQARKRSRNTSSDGTVIKDEAYWERRRKNNEAAKRSRDSRRAKEDEIAIRAAFLEQENLKLRVEVTALKNETAKLRCLLYNS